MKYNFINEATYAADMRRLCILEGHKPGLPVTPGTNKGVTQARADRSANMKRTAIQMFVDGKSTRVIAEHLRVSFQTVREAVRDTRREMAQ